jgi:hypothetical protein
MKSVAGYVVILLILLAAGGLLWFAGRSEERLAAAEYSLVTLRYERAAAELDAATRAGILDPLIRRISPVTSDEPASAHYWFGDYEGLSTSSDPALRLLATNADYRALRQTGGPWQTVVGRLDAIAKRYADILRTEPGNEDAAFNYEFVLRLRTTVATVRKPLVGDEASDGGVTVHGIPGAPPEESDAKKFKMIVPMLPDERQEAEEAGRAARKLRRG